MSNITVTRKKNKKSCTLYAWPFREENPIIAPSDFWRCPLSDRLYPIYKSSDCTPYFVVRVKLPKSAKVLPNAEEMPEPNACFGPMDLTKIDKGIQPLPQEELPSGVDLKAIKKETKVEAESAHPSIDSKLPKEKNGWCAFCKSNTETADVYQSHNLMSRDNKVTCPILRRFICPDCKATGDDAHTAKYCPLRPQQEKIRNRHMFPRMVRTSTGKLKVCRH